MQARSRYERSASFHVFANEFRASTLHEKGPGEYDPSYLISPLGAKINRMVVCGLLERLEHRELSNGSSILQGQVRDCSGVFFFSIGDYAPDAVKEIGNQWLEQVEIGEVLHVAMTVKARWYQSEDGGIFTSIRPEEVTTIEPSTYALWLARTSEETMKRIDAYNLSLELEINHDSFEQGGIPNHLIDGLLQSRSHYDSVEVESFKMNVYQALDICEGNVSSARAEPQLVEMSDSDAVQASPSTEIEKVILELIGQLDQGNGVDSETISRNLAARGYSGNEVYDILESLIDDSGKLVEPKFGWYKLA